MVFVTAAIALGANIVVGLGITSITSAFALGAIGFAAQFALGFLMSALAPKPSSQTNNRGYDVNSFGSALDHQIIYGEVKTGGAVVYDNVTDNSLGTDNILLHRIIAFAGHEVDSFVEFYADDVRLFLDAEGYATNGPYVTQNPYNARWLQIRPHYGTDNQSADSQLVSIVPEWTNNHRLQGIAYLYVMFEFNADVYPNGVPTITAVVRGKKVYDPRTDTTAWSANPALCIRDYLTSGSYGLGESTTNIDDTLFSTAADVCDNLNYPTLTGGIKFSTNGAFTTAVAPYDFLNNIMSSMGGTIWYSQGKWRVKPAYYTTPVANLTDDDLRSSISIQTRHSRRDNFNTVKGTFKGAETNWQVTDYPEYTNAAFVTEDNGQSSVVDLDLPFTSSSVIARRIARIALERNRQQLTVSASFGMKAFGLQVGDLVTLTSVRRGWDAKEFEIVTWNFGIVGGNDLQVQLSLREISESVFDEVDDGVVYTRDNTTLLSPFEVPNIGISATPRLQVVNEKLTNIIEVGTTSGSPLRIDYVEVQFKPSADTSWKTAGTGELGKFEVVDLDDGFYDVRARAVNTFNIKGEWRGLFNISAKGLALPPQDVVGFTPEINGAVLQLEWDAVADLDLSYYRVRYTPNIITPSWGNSVNYSDKVPRPATSVTVPARAGTFLIKAIDKSGSESINATTLVVRPDDLEQFTTTLTQTEDPTFDGVKTDCLVVDNALRIAEATLFDDLEGNLDDLVVLWDNLGIYSVGNLASYEFVDYIDIGSVKRARVYVDSFTSRFNTTANLWDNLAGPIDLLPGLWDDLTEAGDFADTNVKVYVSTTNDDPTGTPTWSGYTAIRVADISARAFRFKINLESDTSGITPTVTELQAVVQHN